MHSATVSAKGARRWDAGHPWIYRSDLVTAPHSDAGVVRVMDQRGKPIGVALWSPRSEISLRLLDSDPDASIDGEWWHRALARAIARRSPLANDTTACRLVHGEGDLIPSLIVDRYDRWIVVQLMSAGLEPFRGEIVHALTELVSPDPNDPIYKTNPGSYAAELHERLASPLYAFAFVLLVVAFMGQAQTTRTSRTQAVIAAFAVAVLSRILGITCANMVVVRPAAAPLLYAVPAAAALLAAVAIQWHMYPRRPSRVARAARGLLEWISATLAALWPRRRAPAPSGMGA